MFSNFTGFGIPQVTPQGNMPTDYTPTPEEAAILAESGLNYDMQYAAFRNAALQRKANTATTQSFKIPVIGQSDPQAFDIIAQDKIRQTISQKSLGTAQYQIPLNNKMKVGM
ncbi:MAG: hypothetical protein JHC33_07715 [Ignisphaera sp.]|nr:hypothetical protein [Ignisphaera sp.]